MTSLYDLTALALDGPLNGTYIDRDTAHANGYVMKFWPTGEEAWVHGKSKHVHESRDFDPHPDVLHPEDKALIEDIIQGGALR
jgi:hypothetical protein